MCDGLFDDFEEFKDWDICEWCGDIYCTCCGCDCMFDDAFIEDTIDEDLESDEWDDLILEDWEED